MLVVVVGEGEGGLSAVLGALPETPSAGLLGSELLAGGS